MHRTTFNKLINIKPYTKRNLFRTWSSLATTFNSRPNPKFNLIKDNVGLFNISELQSYEGFHILKEKCISESNTLIEEATSTNRNRKIVEVFDELSDCLCKVADLAEFIRLAHPSAIYIQAAEIVSGAASGIVEKLNTDRRLYDALKNVVDKGDTISTNAIDNHVAGLFLFDFEQSGIHLPKNDRNKVVSLNNSILQLGQHFVSGSAKPRVVKKDILPHSVKNAFSSDGDFISVTGLNADSSNPVVREIAYRIFLHPDSHQEYLLTELLNCRHELAETCGFVTYSHRALNGSVMESPDAVIAFLDKLSAGVKERSQADFHIMNALKLSEVPSSGPLAPWDVAYYTHKVKREKFKVAGSEYSPYFSLGACMEGINMLLNNLYGITFENQPVSPGECWVDDVYKLAVLHESEGLLGYIYCDFYERNGKPNQDCHFTIRGGKVLPDGSYQQPIVVLMLNLPRPKWGNPSLLFPGMVENLFHEMGHAMHSMLARTQYQHVTGTRCSTDFAEVPSILMEYFASDARVLKTFARHFQTKELIPDEMLHRLCVSKNIFMASEMQLQIFYSALDQFYHGPHPLKGTTTEVIAEAQNHYYNLQYVPNTAWQLRFSHLVGYGAKYYSYLVSRALASWIWQTYFESDPFSRTQGERYRRECLAHGGGKPPWQLIADFLQRSPTPTRLAESLIHEIDRKGEVLDFANDACKSVK